MDSLPKKINEDQWFQLFQPLLLQIIETQYGRDLLEIPKDFPKINYFAKNEIRGEIQPGQYISEFRIGSKWGNVIRQRWGVFQNYAQKFYLLEDGLLLPVLQYNGQLVAANATKTFYPNPNPEITSVDGVSGRSSVSETWATIRDNTVGNNTGDTGISISIWVGSDTVSNRWKYMVRGFFLFDTSSINIQGIIDSATFSVKRTGGRITDFGKSIVVCSSNPASNTALVHADYNKLGTTDFSNRILITNIASNVYQDFTMNENGKLSGISLGGISKLGLRNTSDLDNIEPTWISNSSDLVTFHSADRSGIVEDPKLAITYHFEQVNSGSISSITGTHISKPKMILSGIISTITGIFSRSLSIQPPANITLSEARVTTQTIAETSATTQILSEAETTTKTMAEESTG
jgi:hypothetical protein